MSDIVAIRNNFAAPSPRYRPMARWWWPGGDVTEDELRREMRMLDEAGFGGVEIQPFSFGLDPASSADSRARVHDYLTPIFFAKLEAVLDEAEQRDMWVDWTFGSGWPFGGGYAITPELCAMELRFSRVSVTGPGKYEAEPDLPPVTLPPGSEHWPDGWVERLEARSKLVAIVAVRGSEGEYAPFPTWFGPQPEGEVIASGQLDGDPHIITDTLGEDGVLRWDVPDGEWLIFTFRQVPPRQLETTASVGEGPSLVLDHLGRDAFAAHAERVGDATARAVGRHFGTSLRAIFVDSLELQAHLYWTDDFLEEFEHLRGYDLTPWLPLVRHPGFAEPFSSHPGKPLFDTAGIGDGVRQDYWQTVSDLMVDRVYQPFVEWARNHGLLARIQAHGAPADVLKIYGLADIAETEQLGAFGSLGFMNVAASAAFTNGHPLVSSEAFCEIGDPYSATPQWLRGHADREFSAGVNQIVYHGFAYEYEGHPVTGWYPFDKPMGFSTFLNSRNTFWPYMAPLNAYMSRLQYILQSAEPVFQVGIYRHELSYDSGGVSGQAEPPEPETQTRLREAGYGFCQLNTEALMGAGVENGTLVLPGGGRLEALVIEDCTSLPVELAERLAMYASLELSIYMVGAPAVEADGLRDRDDSSARVRRAMDEITRLSSDSHALGSVDELVGRLQARVRPSLVMDSPADISFNHRRLADLDVFFVMNNGDSPETVNIRFFVDGEAQLWDAWNGSVRRLDTDDDGMFSVPLLPRTGQLIVMDRSGSPSPDPTPITRAIEAKSLSDVLWNLQMTGVGWSGDAVTLATQLESLTDWTGIPGLGDFSGTGDYTATFELSEELASESRLMLSLGDVRDVAEVTINGLRFPPLLMHPYEVDATGALRAGTNSIRIRVVNSLTNAMLRQTQERFAIPNMLPQRTAPAPAGMIGPVAVYSLNDLRPRRHGSK